MARIQCPTCGRSEIIDLNGRYLVECDQCGTVFFTTIAGNRPVKQAAAVCPECGKSELVSLSGSVKVRIQCDQCGHQFIFEGGHDS